MYEVVVSFFADRPKTFTLARTPDIGKAGSLVIQNGDYGVIYAAGAWSGFTVRELKDGV